MIEWLSLAELDARLLRYPPIGLRLRPFFHARTTQDPTTTIARPAEEFLEEGLDPAHAWGGLIDTLPFALRAAPRPYGGFGLEVLFPVRPGGDRVLFKALAKLALPTLTSAYFETLTPGTFGVAPVGDREPVYSSTSRADAADAAALLNSWAPGSHAVMPIEAPPAPWLVIGPASGPYISRVEVTHDEATAYRLASAWSTELGAEVRVARSL